MIFYIASRNRRPAFLRIENRVLFLSHSSARLNPSSPRFGFSFLILRVTFQRVGLAVSNLGTASRSLVTASPSFGETGIVFGETCPRLGTARPTFGNVRPRLEQPCPRFGDAFSSFGHPFPTFGRVFPSLGTVCPKVGHGLPRLGQGRDRIYSRLRPKKRAVHDSPRGDLFQVDFQSQRFVEIVIGAHGRGNGQRLGHFLLGQAGFLAEHFVSAQTILAAVDGRHGDRD